MDSHHQTGARKQNENVENLERSSERIKNMQSTLSHHDFFFSFGRNTVTVSASFYASHAKVLI